MRSKLISTMISLFASQINDNELFVVIFLHINNLSDERTLWFDYFSKNSPSFAKTADITAL